MKSLMDAILVIFVTLFFVIGQAQAKIIFDWTHTELISKENREEAEVRFAKAASQYLTGKFANLGPYDFVNSDDKFFIMIFDNYEKENDAKAEYFPGVRGGTIFVDPSFLDNFNIFQIGAFHELSHAYDYAMTDRMKREIRFFMKVRHLVGIDVKEMRKWYKEYLTNSEKRAILNEDEYIQNLRSQISNEDYSKAMEHVNIANKYFGLK